MTSDPQRDAYEKELRRLSKRARGRAALFVLLCYSGVLGCAAGVAMCAVLAATESPMLFLFFVWLAGVCGWAANGCFEKAEDVRASLQTYNLDEGR